MIGLYVCLQNIYGGNNNVGIDDQEQESTILILKAAWAAILGNRHDRRKERYRAVVLSLLPSVLFLLTRDIFKKRSISTISRDT